MDIKIPTYIIEKSTCSTHDTYPWVPPLVCCSSKGRPVYPRERGSRETLEHCCWSNPANIKEYTLKVFQFIIVLTQNYLFLYIRGNSARAVLYFYVVCAFFVRHLSVGNHTLVAVTLWYQSYDRGHMCSSNNRFVKILEYWYTLCVYSYGFVIFT